MNPSTIDSLPVEDKRVFIRMDFNVPLTARVRSAMIRVSKRRSQPSGMPAKREPRSFSPRIRSPEGQSRPLVEP